MGWIILAKSRLTFSVKILFLIRDLRELLSIDIFTAPEFLAFVDFRVVNSRVNSPCPLSATVKFFPGGLGEPVITEFRNFVGSRGTFLARSGRNLVIVCEDSWKLRGEVAKRRQKERKNERNIRRARLWPVAGTCDKGFWTRMAALRFGPRALRSFSSRRAQPCDTKSQSRQISKNLQHFNSFLHILSLCTSIYNSVRPIRRALCRKSLYFVPVRSSSTASFSNHRDITLNLKDPSFALFF